MSQLPCVLFVDDEPNVLSGLRRTVRGRFRAVVAEGGQAALDVLRDTDDIAVVVSDMRMPGMDGAEFLTAVREGWPDVVRILLTGQADLEAAIAAVNRGQIFRFLTKPCPPDVLLPTLETAAEQYRLVHAERELTEGTLRGAVQVLADVLSLANPAAFSAANNIRAIVSQLAERLELEDPWQFEVAALLSQLGGVALPEDVLARHRAGQDLNEDEIEAVSRIPSLGADLLDDIPRLEEVAEMVRLQREPVRDRWLAEPWPRTGIGASLLRVATDLDALTAAGRGIGAATDELAQRRREYHPAVLEALLTDPLDEGGEEVVRTVPVTGLRPGMVLDEDLSDADGTLLVSRGHAVSAPLLARIDRFRHLRGLPQRIRVRIPSGSAGHEAAVRIGTAP